MLALGLFWQSEVKRRFFT